MRKLIAVLMLLLAASSASAADVVIAGHPAQAGRILLEPAAGAGSGLIRDIESRGFIFRSLATKDGMRTLDRGLAVTKSLGAVSGVRFISVEIPAGLSIEAALKDAEKIPGVKAAWPNFRHKLLDFTPNDPYYDKDQKNFKQVRFPAAWDFSFGSGVTVAVIDTGYRNGLDDAAELVSPYDFWGGDEDVEDFIGHGTLVANVIGEASNNGIGCASIAPASKIMPLKVFPDSDDGALDEDIARAIDWARNEGANVVNMSLGGGGFSGISNGAVDDAYNAGIILFAATGNDGTTDVNYPAGYENVVAVGSSTSHEPGDNPTRSSFSNYGEGLDLVAPGEAIVQEAWSPGDGVGYFSSYGTSVASPHAAGLAALLISLSPDKMTPDDILQAMIDSANTNKSEWDEEIGWGEIDAKAAVDILLTEIPNKAPVAKISVSPASGDAPLTVTLSAGQSYDPDGAIVSYFWSLPDMTTHTGPTITFTFDELGRFSVLLTVKDKYGAGGSDTATVEVMKGESGAGGDSKNNSCGCSVSGQPEPDIGAVFLLLGMAMIGLMLVRRR